MAWLKRVNGSPNWYLEWREQRRVVRRTTGTKDKRLAQKYLAELETDLWRKKHGIAIDTSGVTLGLAMEEYLRVRNTAVKPKTARMNLWALRNFAKWIGPGVASAVKLAAVNHALLDDYFHARRNLNGKRPGEPVADSTLAIEARHLKAFFMWCVQREWTAKNPVRNIPRIRVKADQVKFLTLDEVQRLLALPAARAMRELFYFLLLTGARIGETVQLTWSSIHRPSNRIIILSRTTKAGKPREIEISESLRALLDKMQATESLQRGPLKRIFPWSAGWCSHKFKRCAREIGLDEAISIHHLRHTAASWWIMSGVDLKTVSEILGHSSIAVTERHYGHLCTGHKAKHMENTPLARLGA